MQELFDHSFSLINVIPTFLLFFSLVYWVIVMIGAIDTDFLDVDIDLDMDADIDMDVDLDVDADVPEGASIGWFNSVLTFFNLGQIPLMIFITFLALPMWFIAIVGNYYLGVSNFIIALLLLIPNFIVSLFLAKFATMPFVKLFTRLKKEGTSNQSLTGKICKVILVASDSRLGQAEINEDGTSYLISTKTTNGLIIKKGETALVIDFNKESNVYHIEPYQV